MKEAQIVFILAYNFARQNPTKKSIHQALETLELPYPHSKTEQYTPWEEAYYLIKKITEWIELAFGELVTQGDVVTEEEQKNAQAALKQAFHYLDQLQAISTTLAEGTKINDSSSQEYSKQIKELITQIDNIKVFMQTVSDAINKLQRIDHFDTTHINRVIHRFIEETETVVDNLNKEQMKSFIQQINTISGAMSIVSTTISQFKQAALDATPMQRIINDFTKEASSLVEKIETTYRKTL